MADNGETTFVFKANTKPAEGELENFGDKVGSIGKKIGVAFAAYFSFNAIKGGLEKSISAAIDADKAVKELNNALGITGQYTEAASKAFQDYASKLQSSTGISDEVITRGAASLVQLGKVSTENLNKVTKASLDLAVGMGVDVSTAFDIMTKAANGNVMALSRYGIKANEAKSDSEKFASVLSQIQQRFGGLAEANVDPFSKLKTSIDEAFESIGKAFTHSKNFKAAASVIAGEIDKLILKFIKFNESTNFIDNLVDNFFKIGSVISQFILAPIEAIARITTTSFTALPILMANTYGKVAQIMDKVFGTNISSKIKPIIDGLNSFQEAAISPLITDDQLISTRMAKGLEDLRVKVIETAATIKTEIPTAAAVASDQSLSSWSSLVNGFSGGFKTMAAFTEDFKKNLVSLGATLRNTVANGFTNAFASIGKALVTGEDAFGSFGKAILQMLGQVAMQMGQFYIAAGIAAMFLNPAQGAGLIAGGAALSVLGGVLQALAGGGGGAGATAGAGSSAVNPAYTQEVGGQFITDQERAKASTGVQVIVQGNVFDTRETGLQIAKILSDSFDTNGTIVRGFA